jgi:hypothetical protein
MKKSISTSYLEFAILFLLTIAYCFGITVLARKTVWFEIIFGVVLPIVVYLSRRGSGVEVRKRIVQLIVIESIFILIVIVSKFSIFYESASMNHSLNYLILAFFVGQTTLFLIDQRRLKSYFGMVRSFFLFTMLVIWFRRSETVSFVDSQGRFLFWSGDAPFLIQVYYCVWVTGVLLADSKIMPNFKQAFPHLASVAVAFCSQEFFHSRLLTACHLFVLDMLFVYTGPNSGSFCVITDEQNAVYEKYVRKSVDWITFVGCIAIFLYSLQAA